MIFIDGPHPATLPEDQLLVQCQRSFGRNSGPGGQHRNKVETSVRILHVPTGIEASAGERRRQIENRRMALRRLRIKLATEIRTRVSRQRHRPGELWESRRQGRSMPLNPKHADYPALLAEALDLIVARDFDVAGAAGLLNVSMSQLAKLVRHHKQAFALVNAGRRERGLATLK